MSDDTRHLLHDAAPSPVQRPDVERLWARGRRRRHTVRAGAAVTAIAGVVAVAAVVPGLGPGPGTGLEVADQPPGGCPITEPGATPFTPPEPHVFADPGIEGASWYGTPELWTVVSDPSGPQKSVWWSADFDVAGENGEPDIQVVYERLDDPDADRIVFDGPGTNAFTDEQGWFMIAGMQPDEPGCWQATATYRDAELTVVYRIEEPAALPLPPAGTVTAEFVDGHPVFVVHDDLGSVRVLDAVSPHVGTDDFTKVLAWCESAGWFEDLWHGSRFDPDGDWLGGPAPTGMAPYDLERGGGWLTVGDQRAAPARPEPPDTDNRFSQAGPSCDERTALWMPGHPGDPAVLDDLVVHDPGDAPTDLWYPTPERIRGEVPTHPSLVR